MGFYNTAKEVFKDSARLRLDWRENANGVAGLFSKDRQKASVAIDIEDQEFLQRYKNVRFASASSLFFMAVSFISVPMAHSMMGFFTSIVAVLLFFLFYFRYAFVMWVCRDRWSRGENLEAAVTNSTMDYLRRILQNPAEFLPLALPEKGAQK